MSKRFTDTDKFKKNWIKDLDVEMKLAWIYLLDACNLAGIWDIEIDVMNMRLGTNIKLDKLISIFNGKLELIDNGKKIFIRKFVTFQYGDLNPQNRVHASVLRELKKEGVDLRGLISPLQTLSHRVKDKDKDKAKDKDKDKEKANTNNNKQSINNIKFIMPTLEDVSAYIQKRKSSVNAQKFFDYYQTRGWILKGGQKMKDWQSAVRTWENNEYGSSKETEIKCTF